jgi:DNA replication and repair protein RecF
MTSCAITQLTLQDFRTYEALRLQPSARLIALAGTNGAGKTNVLEAISMLAPGAGLRGADLSAMARLAGPGGWAVAARAQVSEGEVQLGTSWAPSAETATRAAMVDGRRLRSVSGLSQHLRQLWLTPAMDRLFSGPAGDRRRFLDRAVLLFDPAHASRVNSYDKLVRERMSLLEDARRDTTWLATLENQIAETAIAICHARLDAATLLDRFLGEVLADSPFPWGTLAVTGEAEALAESHPSVAAEEIYRQRLATNRGLDQAAGRTLFGPHRSDLSVSHGPKGMVADLCSTGEQKALLVGLVLAQARAARAAAGITPLLLLDEVTAHLDSERRKGLFSVLENLGAQAWITGTDAEIFDGASPAMVVYKVAQGGIAES